MTYRTTFLTLAMLLSAPVFAGQPGADLQSASALPAAAADKVYPPLPSLAMLPPASGDDDDDLPVKPARHKKKSHMQVQERRAPPGPAVRIVVTDDSHAYLDSVERQIDQASIK